MARNCKFSAATPSLGRPNGSANINVNSNLFAGQNDNDQNVFSWVATDPVEEFYTDISPLFDFILTLNTVKGFDDLLVDIPTVDTFLGYVGFGTQAYNSIGNVTFAVPRLGMDIRPFDKLT